MNSRDCKINTYYLSFNKTRNIICKNQARVGLENGIPLDYIKSVMNTTRLIMKFETPTLIPMGDKDINTNINYFKDTCNDIMTFLGLKIVNNTENEIKWLTGC